MLTEQLEELAPSQMPKELEYKVIVFLNDLIEQSPAHHLGQYSGRRSLMGSVLWLHPFCSALPLRLRHYLLNPLGLPGPFQLGTPGSPVLP